MFSVKKGKFYFLKFMSSVYNTTKRANKIFKKIVNEGNHGVVRDLS